MKNEQTKKKIRYINLLTSLFSSIFLKSPLFLISFLINLRNIIKYPVFRLSLQKKMMAFIWSNHEMISIEKQKTAYKFVI